MSHESQSHSTVWPASSPEQQPAALLFRVKMHSCLFRAYNCQNSPQKQSSLYNHHLKRLRSRDHREGQLSVSVTSGWNFWEVEAGLYMFKNWQFIKIRTVKMPADGKGAHGLSTA